MDNFLKSGDNVKVDIIDSEGKTVYSFTSNSENNFAKATGEAFSESGLNDNPKNYIFAVTDESNGKSIKLRLNDQYFLEEA